MEINHLVWTLAIFEFVLSLALVLYVCTLRRSLKVGLLGANS
jgi:hypothetical protein